MLVYIAQRILFMIPTLIAISIVTFIIIQLPPGDFVTSLAAQMSQQGDTIDPSTLALLRAAIRARSADLGPVLELDLEDRLRTATSATRSTGTAPVSDLIWNRLGLTFVLSFTALVFTWVIAFPIGIYSAVRKYSIGDYLVTFLGFIGLAMPNFLLALILMYIALQFFGLSVGGLFSPEFVDAPWSWAKVMRPRPAPVDPGDRARRSSGTAALIRIMRANLLDELNKPYVITARAKGLSEWRLILKYPVRAALNPFVSTIGWILPELVSGAIVTAIVLNLPTTGPLLLRALIAQDMYLAGAIILMLCVLTVIGTLISDLLLAWLDPAHPVPVRAR